MSTTTPPRLPSAEALALAEEKLTSFKSDLDWFASNLERAARGEPMTLAQYRYAVAEAIELPEHERYDRDELARLVVFATNVLSDAEEIAADGRTLQQAALALYNEEASDA